MANINHQINLIAEQQKKSNAISVPLPLDETKLHLLKDDEIADLLRVLSKNIHIYSTLLGLKWEDVEFVQRQYAAYSWVMVMKEKLQEYSKQISKLKSSLRKEEGENSVLSFFDLPRPPVLYPNGNINHGLETIITKIKKSPHYSSDIGRDLGLE